MLAYTRPGDLVVLASGTSVAAPYVEGFQRRCAGLTTTLAHGAPADLVLTTTPTSPPSLALARIAAQYRAARQVLHLGGFLVTVTQPAGRVDRGAVGCRPSDVVRAAQRAGFGYLQHNVAVHAPVAGGRRRPGQSPSMSSGRAVVGLPMHCVVHSDVLAFTAQEATDG